MNDVTEALIEAVTDACERYPSQTEAGGDAQWNGALWAALEQIGVTLLSVSEDAGGAGGDLPMAVSVLETLAEHSANVPYAETALQAAWMLQECGAELVDGPLAAAVAGPDVSLREAGEAWMLDGVFSRVPWARYASQIVLLVDRRVVIVDPADAEISPGANLAGEPRDDVVIRNLSLPTDRVFHLGVDSAVSADAFLARGALARVAMIAGAARQALGLSVRYAGQREQFGRPIKAFQAVQQQLAAMAGEVLLCKIAAESAAASLDADPAAGLPVAAAKASSAEAAGTVARIAHQIHGAIGFTDEHELRLSTTRLWAWREECGTEGFWSKRLGAWGLEAGPEQLWPLLIDRP